MEGISDRPELFTSWLGSERERQRGRDPTSKYSLRESLCFCYVVLKLRYFLSVSRLVRFLVLLKLELFKGE
jgi:hypothetical protein